MHYGGNAADVLIKGDLWSRFSFSKHTIMPYYNIVRISVSNATSTLWCIAIAVDGCFEYVKNLCNLM